MRITRLALDHYRSWRHVVIDFPPGVTILQGANGIGKTNMVEAIEVLATGVSHRVAKLAALVERGEERATIRVNVLSDATMPDEIAAGNSESGNNADISDSAAAILHELKREQTYEVTIAARGANRARINGGASLYLRDVVGLVPCVTFAPEDQHMAGGEPSVKRVFLDQAGALLIAHYAERLQQYRKIAKQRAALLKQLGDTPRERRDAALSGLEVWTGQLIAVGVRMTRDRLALVQALNELFQRAYADVTGSHDAVALEYRASFAEVLEAGAHDADAVDGNEHDAVAASISTHFQRLYEGELARGQNLIGPHRDDMAILLNGEEAQDYASNGELWSLALALKMALYELITRQRGVKPLLILDDVFAQLDEVRREQILQVAARQPQSIITVAALSDVPRLAAELANQQNSQDVQQDVHYDIEQAAQEKPTNSPRVTIIDVGALRA